MSPDRVVLCGVRGALDDFDGAGRAAVERSAIHLVPPGSAAAAEAVAALGGAPVYVHLDPDALDPGDNPVPYGRPGGLRLGELHALLRAVPARGPVVGVEGTAFHTDDDPGRRVPLAHELAEAVAASSGPLGQSGHEAVAEARGARA